METDQAGQLDVLWTQSAKVLNKNREAEETYFSTSSKTDNGSPSQLDS